MNNKISFIKQKGQRGQVAVIITLLMLVGSLVILAATARSISNVSISETSEGSARAFAASEAGIEDAFEKINTGAVVGIIGSAQPITLSGSVNGGSYIVTQQGMSTNAYLSTTPLVSDIETFQVVLSDTTSSYANVDSTICILFGDTGTPSPPAPAIEVMVVNNTGGIVDTVRFAIDSSIARTSTNHFIPANNDPSCTLLSPAASNNVGVDRTFKYAHKFTLPAIASTDRLLLRIRMLYSNSSGQYVGVLPILGGSLPAQGYKISSTGLIGDTQRKIEVFQAFPSLPALFDFSFYNGSTKEVKK